MKINSWDPKKTLSILRLMGINPKEWDKIMHVSDSISLSRTSPEGDKETKYIDLNEAEE